MADVADPSKGDSAKDAASKPAAAPAPVPAQKPVPVRVEEKEEPHAVLIRPYPKSVFLYPLALTSLACGIMSAAHIGDPRHLGFIFVLVFFWNVLLMSFEFTRHVSLALVLAAFVVVLLGMLLNQRVPVLHFLHTVYDKLDFVANAEFYFAVAFAYALVLGGIFIDVRMDYWEVRGNEVLHYHGFLGDVERFPAPSLKMRKEINDVFEYLLLLSGRLVLYPAGAERPIVLDNVPHINKIEDRIEEMLDNIRVTIEPKSLQK
jgi:hypothetical protein